MKPILFTLPIMLTLGCASGPRRAFVTDLDGSVAPLRERFNAEASVPRIVALLSPC